MDTNKILSADLLDLVFDNRNKEYGAYDLRKTYHTRIAKSLIFTGVFISLIFTSVVLANTERTTEERYVIKPAVILTAIEPDVKEPEPLPKPPPRQIETPQIRTEQLTNLEIVPNEEVIEPPPTQDDLTNAKIGVVKQEGLDFAGLVEYQKIEAGKEILAEKIVRDESPLEFVQVEATFDGNWEKFLLRNLNPQTPIDNDAPAGKYKVLIQFVVDVDGTVSDIRPLTNLGYGLEQEALRVLKKAAKWKPAIQNGHLVKAYRRQAITFEVTTED